MQKTLPTILVLIALALPLLPQATAQTTELAADLNNAVEVWSGFMVFSKTATKTNYYATFMLASNDLDVIRTWGGAYVVVKITNIDSFKGNPPRLSVLIKPLGGDSNVAIYSSEKIPVKLGMNEIYIPAYVFSNSALDDGAYIILVMDIGWAPDATDAGYGMHITKILLAPPVPSGPSEPSSGYSNDSGTALSGGFPQSNILYAAMGAGAIVILLAFLMLAGRVRVKLAVVVLAAVGASLGAGLAVAQVDVGSYITSAALDTSLNTLNTTLSGYGVTVNGSIVMLTDPDPVNDTYIPAVLLDALPFDAVIRVLNGTVRAGDPQLALIVTNGTIVLRGSTVVVDDSIAIDTTQPVIASDNATLLVEPLYSAEFIETGSTITKTGSTPPTAKYKVYLAPGKVLVKKTENGGTHDVYIFKPSNPKYSEVYASTSTVWQYYVGKADWKMLYPVPQTSFNAPEQGYYLFVVVKFTKDGPFTLKITPPTGGTTTKTTTTSKMPTTTSSANPSAPLPDMGGTKAKYMAFGIGIIILLLAVMMLGGRRR